MLRDLHHSQRTPQRPSFRLHVEPLEYRDTPSTTVLGVSPSPATAGQVVTLTATVTESGADNLQPGRGIPPGVVTFLDGVTPIMSVTVAPKGGTTNQGVATLTTAALSAGAHALTARYSGEMLAALFMASPSTSDPVAELVNVPVPPLTDVTPQVSVVVRRGLPRGQQLVTVTNTSGQEISGPRYLVFTKLPKRVRLKGASGVTRAHDPFLLDAVTLLPGGYATFLVAFTGHKVGHFTTEVFAGNGTP
jgi:hypothetical protein